MDMENEDNEGNKDNFEISLRILGNEMIGMRITSQSKTKKWAVFGLVTLIAIAMLANEFGPALMGMVTSIGM
jgi:hypothetical protein